MPGPRPRHDKAAVIAHYRASGSLRRTADAFGLSVQRVRDYLIQRDPSALRVWGAGGKRRDDPAGGVRGWTTAEAIRLESLERMKNAAR